jgi:hypothetical protein
VVTVTLFDDTSNARTAMVATPALANLFSYAHQWALQEDRKDSCTLSFSSMLAAMTAGTDPLCGWLRSHLALRGVRSESMTKKRGFSVQPLPDILKTTSSFRRAFEKARELCPNEQKDGIAVPPAIPSSPAGGSLVVLLCMGLFCKKQFRVPPPSLLGHRRSSIHEACAGRDEETRHTEGAASPSRSRGRNQPRREAPCVNSQSLQQQSRSQL